MSHPPAASDKLPVTSNSVFDRLFREGYQFDFFQVVRLLEIFFANIPKERERDETVESRIRIRPHSGLAFPATDVRNVELLDGKPQRARVTATFMGLYGIDSPLPVYFYKEIATETDPTKPLRDFLDVFNHRVYALFYRAWKKYRPALHYTGDDAHSQRALCLTGLATPKAFDNPPLRLAAFAGRLSCRVRNAEGLKKLIEDFFPTLQVTIRENEPRWWPIPERPRMGRGSASLKLGANATIGEKIFDVSGKFRIVLAPLTLVEYMDFLPGGGYAAMIQYLVRLYAPDYLDFDVALRLKTSEIPRLRMGMKGTQLGLTTWSGRPRGELTSRVVVYEEAKR
jgi:type VI secretion system protein ImpH